MAWSRKNNKISSRKGIDKSQIIWYNHYTIKKGDMKNIIAKSIFPLDKFWFIWYNLQCNQEITSIERLLLYHVIVSSTKSQPSWSHVRLRLLSQQKAKLSRDIPKSTMRSETPRIATTSSNFLKKPTIVFCESSNQTPIVMLTDGAHM